MPKKKYTNKIKILYHQRTLTLDCPDGLAAAYVARLIYPEAQLIGCMYQKELPIIDDGDTLIIVDFSFTSDILQAWSDRNIKIILIDHHETAEEMLFTDPNQKPEDVKEIDISQGLIREDFITQRRDANRVLYPNFTAGVLKFDMNKCAAVLTWEYFFPDNVVPAWLYYVQDRDLFTKKLRLTEEIHEALGMCKMCDRTHDKIFKFFDYLCTLSNDELLARFEGLGRELLAPKRKRIAELLPKTKFTNWGDAAIAVVEIPKLEVRLTSDLAAEVYNKYPIDFAVVFYIDPDKEEINLSFRSSKESRFNVRKLAELLGGGGHFSAAGARVKKLPWL